MKKGPRSKAAADSEAIYNSIKTPIMAGRMPEGSQLPTERAIASRYNAARNTVRKTMQRLVDEGLIVRHVGRGTFVAQTTKDQSMAPPASGEYDLDELFEARLLFEPGLAELVVDRSTDDELASLTIHLDAIRTAEAWLDLKEAKYALHLEIVRLCKNRFIEHMFETVIASRRRAGWGRPGRHPRPVNELRERAMREYAAIVDALQKRDHKAAHKLIRACLLRSFVSVSGI